MEQPKKLIKSLKDVEKVMKLMQKNLVSSVIIDGHTINIGLFPSSNKTENSIKDEDVEFWSSN